MNSNEVTCEFFRIDVKFRYLGLSPNSMSMSLIPLFYENVTVHQELYLLFHFDPCLNCFNTMIPSFALCDLPNSSPWLTASFLYFKVFIIIIITVSRNKLRNQEDFSNVYFTTMTRSALQLGMFYSFLTDSLSYHRGSQDQFQIMITSSLPQMQYHLSF